MSSEAQEDACDGFDSAATDWTVRPQGDGTFVLHAAGETLRCAIGRTGMLCDKREGDGATPVGRWKLREVLYRADRLPAPATALKVTAIKQGDGWCDAPDDPNYNRPVPLPYAASHEEMWREDGLYDVVVPLGYNDDPPVAGKGSAIFLHVSQADYGPTAGCVAIPRDALVRLLAAASAETHIVVSET